MIRTRSRRSAAWPVAALLGVAAAAAFAQDGSFGGGLDDDVKVTLGEVTVDDESVAPGSSTTLHFPLTVDAGWHLYGLTEVDSMPPSIDVPDWPTGLTEGATSEAPEPHDYESFGVVQKVHEGEVTISLVVNVAPDAAPGPRTITGEIGFQVCNDTSCMPQLPLPFSVTFQVAGELVAAAPQAFDELTKVLLDEPSIEPASVDPGGTAEIRLPLKIAPGWHLYAQSKTENFPPTPNVDTWPAGITQTGLRVEPDPHDIEYFGETVPVHTEALTLILELAIAPDAAGGARRIAGDLTMQACDDSSCMPQEPIPFAFDLIVTGIGGAGAAPAGGDPPVADVVPPAKRKTTFAGLDMALLIQAMTLGLITVLTPCVFPLLPVTVSFFSKQKGPALPRSLVYASGIVFTIVVIGLILQQSLDVLARGDAFNLFIAGLFIFLALSLFGLFDLRVPSFLIDGATRQSAKGGYIGAFFMAVVLALTSFSCSLPFLGIMFTAFDEGATGTAVVGLTVYGSTMAAPFFVCSLFPALINTLPRAGVWMNAIKVTMGFVEFGLAFKFLRTVALNHQWDILPRGLVIAIWVACCFGAALYLFGYLVLPHDTKVESIGVVRLLFAIFFLSIGLYLVPGVIGLRLNPMLDGFLQTQPDELITGFGGSNDAHPEWVKNDWDGTLARASRSKRLALFDFTGVG